MQDCELLGLDPEVGRPEEYIWQYIHVPPVCIRPSVAQEAATYVLHCNSGNFMTLNDCFKIHSRLEMKTI